ncbi:MAG: hypothetical protein DCC67_12945 [Planctomycetota bacterium]|nr:MAG: hypothetical protein DCC67_12945 [Planctomycetota bacterium]
MSDILFHYEKVNPTSWAYLSSLLMLALFFKFNRLFSVRNFDLFLLILLAPGLLLTLYGTENEGYNRAVALRALQLGFTWLFAVGVVLLGRLLADSAMVRRPLLEPNLNAAGLAFLCSSLLFFLMANVVTGRPTPVDLNPARRAADIKEGAESGQAEDLFATEGPGYWLLYLMPRISTQTVIAGAEPSPPTTEAEVEKQEQKVREVTARVMAILSNVLIVSGMIAVGAWHFDNPTAGIAAATMYLLLPYTAKWSGSVEHVLPASLLVWAATLYRRPLAAGLLIGLASGTIYYPIFLLPLWCSFYWQRGVKRFVAGFLVALGALVVSLALTSDSPDRFFTHLYQMFGVRLPLQENLQGIWRNEEGFWNSAYRLPILFAFLCLAVSFVAWPPRKHLGTLISGTAALMVGAQFWHAHEGGIYVAWYLPLLLLAIHRPNLEDRVAVATVAEAWRPSRRKSAAAGA